MLFMLYEILKMPEVGFIFVSSALLDMYHVNTGFVELMQVHFPGYKEEDLFRIFKKNHANQNPLYETFLKDAVVLSSFSKVTRLVPTEDKAQKLNLYERFKCNILPDLNEMFKVPSYRNSLESEANKVKIKIRSADAETIMPRSLF
ncbi:hypothetical protein MKX03_027080 [Papaver bracteatum]|nr:hypothetical protein MKX03_027080 [Papaver bracteatum]